MNPQKLLQKALSSPANLRFEEACALARELVNLQEVKGKAKPYQVRQLLALVEGYNLSLGGEK